MKSGIMLVSVIFVFFAISLSQSSGTDMVILTKNDNGKEITVKHGSLVQIQLEENITTGYSWEFHDLNSRYFEVLKVETVHGGKKGLVGAPSVKKWLIKVKNGGDADLKMHYYRPWEGRDNASDSFSLKVRVIP